MVVTANFQVIKIAACPFVAVQGNCSYSVYAGPSLEYVVQFRLKSLLLDMEVASLAREVYGPFAPAVSFEGQLGDETKDYEESCQGGYPSGFHFGPKMSR